MILVALILAAFVAVMAFIGVVGLGRAVEELRKDLAAHARAHGALVDDTAGKAEVRRLAAEVKACVDHSLLATNDCARLRERVEAMEGAAGSFVARREIDDLVKKLEAAHVELSRRLDEIGRHDVPIAEALRALAERLDPVPDVPEYVA